MPSKPSNSPAYDEDLSILLEMLADVVSQPMPVANGPKPVVSWQGGKPWDVVLNEMLAPSGMKAVIENNQVSIRSMNS